jgi:hypothetical protein
MKQVIVLVLFSLVIAGCLKNDNITGSTEILSPEEVNAQIENLRKLIIPPKGVSKADVDAVFGVPKEITESDGKGTAGMYPMHTYQLLKPEQGREFRAFLYVTYENNKVKYAGINHCCVSKNRVIYPQGSPEQIAQQHEIDTENVHVLADLTEIQQLYGYRLKTASWNKQTAG